MAEPGVLNLVSLLILTNFLNNKHRLTYTAEEIRNNNEDWRGIVTPADTAQTLDNDKIDDMPAFVPYWLEDEYFAKKYFTEIEGMIMSSVRSG